MDKRLILPVSAVALIAVSSCREQSPASSNTQGLNTNLVMFPATTNAPPKKVNWQKFLQSIPPPIPLSPEEQTLQDALNLESQGNHDAALEKANSVLQADPKNIAAYSVCGAVHTKMKLWGEARKDYEAILQLDAKNVSAKFDLSELEFQQKAYDDARPGFVALQKDDDWGDLAAYKVFLCDLLGHHEEVARSELDGFNKVGSNPSFYFANAAWYLVRQQPEEARNWLISAVRIYAPSKIYFYSSTLKDLGYLPLPAPTD
jgi:tetratricopeptide (TPR) repeat protein